VRVEVPLQHAHRLLAARPTCLLTTRYRGRDNVMTLSWTCPVSLEPPLVVLAIHPSRYSHDLLEKGLECVLNIPSRPMGEELVLCGTRSGADGDKLAALGLALESGRRVSAPWLAGCIAHLECDIIDRITPGDHSLFVAEIVGAWAEEEAFSGTWRVRGQPEDLLPLIHLGGSRFGLLGTEIELP
jgi:flavin reductase (DIM6/NTAB) family NADH-FMN oxidoreductase RutF